MRSFAAVILHALAERPFNPILDEPEAFLHPPQARLLGRYIAERKGDTSSQLFKATHNTDVLEGLIECGSDKVRIFRLRREGNVNHIKELSKQHTKSVTEDILARFSRVFDGVFFEHVVICEADADCMFYQSFLSLPAISGDRRPDVLFVHAAGKHRMAKLTDTLRSLDVPVSVIADVDILNDERMFKDLFEELGGNWEEVKSHWKAVSDHVVNRRSPRSAEQVADLIRKELEDVAGLAEFPKEREQTIKRIFKDDSPWSALKGSGRSALAHGNRSGNLTHFARNVGIIGFGLCR